MNTNKILLMGALSAMLYENPRVSVERQNARYRKPRTGREPWQTVQLSKAERRGKTTDEIRALRIQKWAEGANEHSTPII